MEIIEKENRNIHIFTLAGRLDSNTAPGFEERIIQAIGNTSKHLIVDFEKVDYISSAGLRVILKATKDLKRVEGKIVLCAMQDYVREVFEISGFDALLPIVPKIEDALQEFVTD